MKRSGAVAEERARGEEKVKRAAGRARGAEIERGA